MVFDGGIVIENGGIGYEIFVPNASEAYLSHQEEVLIYTTMVVREDDVSIYGFTDKDGLDMFKKLMTISGVGAKAALSVLSSLSPVELKKAIIFDDAVSITKAQGIGKKTAQRIVLELKDKIGNIVGLSEDNSSVVITTDEKTEAIEALISLGYSRSEASEALNKIKTEQSSAEEYIKLALKNLIR